MLKLIICSLPVPVDVDGFREYVGGEISSRHRGGGGGLATSTSNLRKYNFRPILTSFFFLSSCLYHFRRVFRFRLTFGKGTSETPRLTSRRCIVLLILLFGFLIFQFYSASIVGSLLMEKPKTIKTVRNLIDSPLELGIEEIPYNRDYFKVSFSFFFTKNQRERFDFVVVEKSSTYSLQCTK